MTSVYVYVDQGGTTTEHDFVLPYTVTYGGDEP